jgi:hypothetical protein
MVSSGTHFGSHCAAAAVVNRTLYRRAVNSEVVMLHGRGAVEVESALRQGGVCRRAALSDEEGSRPGEQANE